MSHIDLIPEFGQDSKASTVPFTVCGLSLLIHLVSLCIVPMPMWSDLECKEVLRSRCPRAAAANIIGAQGS